MASRFDPSAFIAAERQRKIATVATVAATIAPAPQVPRPAEIRRSAPPSAATIAKVATIAAMEQDGSIWMSAPSLLSAVPRPIGMEKAHWGALVRLLKWTTEDWGLQARELGWDPLEFYGCNPDPFARRLDRDGLVAMLFRVKTPQQVTAVYADHVELRSRGAVLRFRPFGPRGQVYLWDAYAPKGGP